METFSKSLGKIISSLCGLVQKELKSFMRLSTKKINKLLTGQGEQLKENTQENYFLITLYARTSDLCNSRRCWS